MTCTAERNRLCMVCGYHACIPYVPDMSMVLIMLLQYMYVQLTCVCYTFVYNIAPL